MYVLAFVVNEYEQWGNDCTDILFQEEDGFLELQRNPKFFFQTTSGEILSVYKTAIGSARFIV